MSYGTKYREILNSQFSIFNSHILFPPISPTGKKSNTPPYMTYIRIGTPRST